MGNYNEVYMSDGPLYTENEVKDIVHIIESSQFKIEEPKDKKAFINSNKKSIVSAVPWPELKNQLRKFERFIFDSNKLIFKYDIVPFHDSHYLNLNYYDSTNDSYDWHIDGTGYGSTYDLKLTCLLNLSTEKYKGGDLVLFNVEDKASKIIKENFSRPGYALIFTSTHFHKVKPITKGVRRTLSYWAKGPLWR